MIYLLLLFVALLFIGLPLTFLVQPGVELRAGFRAVLAVVAAYCGIVLLGRLYLSHAWTFASFPAVILGLSVFGAGFRWRVLRDYVVGARRELGYFAGFVMFFGLATGVPLLGWRLFGSPLRFGPDGALYGQMAHYLLHNGTIPGIVVDGSFYGMLNQAGFLSHLRWGFPVFLTFVAQIFGAEHPYDTMFVATTVLYVTTGAAVYFYLTEYRSVRRAYALMGLLATLFGSIYLNMLLENQQPNVAMLAAFVVIACLFSEYVAQISLRKDLVGFTAWMALFLGSALVYYSEILPVIILYFGAIAVWGWWTLGRRLTILTDTAFILLGGALLGTAVVGDFAPIVGRHLFHLETGGASVGYAQPLWAWPNHIFGINNMYNHLHEWIDYVGRCISRRRHRDEFIVGGLVSLGLMGFLARDAWRNRAPARLWLPAVPLMLAIFVRSRLHQDGNYLYTKICALCTPFLMIALVNALDSCARTTPGRGKIVRAFIGVWIFTLIIAGGDYVRTYRDSSYVAASNTLNLTPEQIAQRVLFPAMRGCWGDEYRTIDTTRELYVFSAPNITGANKMDIWHMCDDVVIEQYRSMPEKPIFVELRHLHRQGPSEWKDTGYTTQDIHNEGCPEFIKSIRSCLKD